MYVERILAVAIPALLAGLLAACQPAERVDPDAAAPIPPADTAHAGPPHTEPPAIPPHTAPHPPPGDLPDQVPRDTPGVEGAR